MQGEEEQSDIPIRELLSGKGQFNQTLRVFIYLADHLCEETMELINKVCEQLKDSPILLQVFETIIKLFLKENITGPSFYYQDAEQKLRIESQLLKQIIPIHENRDIDQLNDIGLDFLIGIVDLKRLSHVSEYEIYYTESDQEFILNQLQIGGEPFKRVIQLKHLFLVAETILTYIKNDLWIARLGYLHNQFLDNPVGQLKDQVLQAYQKVIQANPKSHHLHIELAYVYNYYYKYTEAEYHLEIAANLLGVKFELTGKMGFRTKFQEDKTSQLIAQIIDDKAVQEEISQLPQINDILQEFAPKQIELGEESILYEKPRIENEDQIIKNERTTLSLDEQILLLGYINHYKRTLADDEILRQQINAYLTLMLDKSLGWIVFSQGLLLRSLNEFQHLKKMERALAQLQVLADQFNEPTPNFYLRYQNVFTIHYPDYYTLSGILAESWMKVGMMQSGYEIFARLEMWEECVECIVAQGDVTRATKEIERLHDLGTTSIKIRCVYAEIKKDTKLLKQVWKDSNKRYARAQRSLGELSFFRDKDYPKAIKHYSKALKINTYHHKSWFILACAQMRINKLEDAIKSFGESVRVDEKDSESWGNIASCLISLKRYKEAMASLEQGVKYAGNDWRLWSNLMGVSLRIKKFVRFYSCVEKLIQLNQFELIDETIVMKINQTFKYQIATTDHSNFRQLALNKDRLIRLFEYLVKEIGQKFYIWQELANLTLLMADYEDVAEQLREKKDPQLLEKQKKQHLNDVAEFRLKSCQMLTIVGWERDLQLCERLAEQIKQLKLDSIHLMEEQQQINISKFIEHMKNRLETILERKLLF